MHDLSSPSQKMKIEIWSDIVCPFCYLGKREFELALDQFQFKDHIEVSWKSFQLSPNLKTNAEVTIYDHLSKEKGIPEDQARKMTKGISVRGVSIGITYNFEQSIVANTFNAHMLLHFAKQFGVQNQVKERLLFLHFTEGANVDDNDTLLGVCDDFNLNRAEFEEILATHSLRKEVQKDSEQARIYGITGVPFFVFDQKYAVSGAQENRVFQETIQHAFDEWNLNSHQQ